MKYIPSILALLGAIAVMTGAFGAHALKPKLTDYQLGIWEKAVFYQFVHVLAGLAAIYLLKEQTAALFFILGILLFSGSLYLLAFKDILGGGSAFKIIGPITPIGGLLFMVGWGILAWKLFQSKGIIH